MNKTGVAKFQITHLMQICSLFTVVTSIALLLYRVYVAFFRATKEKLILSNKPKSQFCQINC